MLVVLGGSSPWTASLLRVLRSELVTLVGRDEAALAAMQRFARRHFGIDVQVTTSPALALGEASVVLCQARIGGPDGRHSDESGAQRWGAWGDETLGIGGVRSAIRSSAVLADWAQKSAGVPCLMFTNPTDLLARWWALHSGAPCVSVCEMPTLLLQDLPAGSRYLGVNHLGYGVTPSGEAYPSKWIRMLDDLPKELEAQRVDPPRRASLVAGLSLRLRRAIADDDWEAVDRLLAHRPPRWYELLIAPLLHYFLEGTRFHGVVGLPNEMRLPMVNRNVVVESLGTGVTPEPLGFERSVEDEVAVFANARQRAFECLQELTEDSLRRYLTVDPLTRSVEPSLDLLAWLRSG